MRRFLALAALLAGCSHAPPPPPPKPPAPDPIAEMKLADEAHDAGDFATARAHLETVVKVAPSLGLAHVDLADTLLRLGEEGPELAQELATAEKLEPQNPRLWRIAGMYAEDQSDAAGAISAYEKAIALRPGDLRSRFRLAGLYAAARRPADAIAQYRACIDGDPTDPASRLSLAELLQGQNDLAGAEAQLTALTAADPANALYKKKLQEVLVAEGKAAPDAPKKRTMRPLRKSKW